MTLTAPSLIDIALCNPINAQIISQLPALQLNQCMLTAGCIFQAVWNRTYRRPASWGVNDYDVFYFDEDLSWEAENEVIVAAQALFSNLDVKVELRNQARVHLWFSDRFGSAYSPLRSAKEGIDRFLICATCVGLSIDSGEIYAPYGLAELEQGVLRMNPNFPQPELYEKKVLSYQQRWEWLSTPDAERGE